MSDQPSRLKSFARRAGKILLRIIAVIIVLVVALLAFTQTGTFKSILREQIIEATNDALLGRVEIGEIQGNLFTGVTAHNVRVYDARDMLAVSVERAEARYSLLALMDSQLDITHLELERPTGIMRYDANGDLNLLQIAKPSDTPEDPNATPFGIGVTNITVRDARLLYVNEPAFATEDPNAIKPDLTPIRTLLATPTVLTSTDLEDSLRPLLRHYGTLPSAPVPALAMISGLELESDFSLDQESVISVLIKPLQTTLDANTWQGPVDLESASLDVRYAPDKLTLDTEMITLSQGASIKPTSLTVDLIPASNELETAYPTTLALSLGETTITRDLLERTLPTIALKDGVKLSATLDGTPQKLDLKANLDTLEAPTKVALEATLDDLLASLLHDLTLPEKAPAPPESPPSYKATLRVDNANPEALLADLPQTDISTTITLTGSGLDPEQDLDATLDLVLDPSTAMTWRADGAHITAHYADKTLNITKGDVRTPYADATLTGKASWPGDVELALTAKTAERHLRSVAIPEVGELSQKRLELDAKLSANFDATAEDIVQSLSATRLDASWDIAQLEQGDTLELGSSKGSVELDLSSTQDPKTRRVKLALDALARDVKAPDVTVRSADITASSRITIPWVPEDFVALRHRLLANVDIQLEGARAAGASIGALDANLALSPSSANGLDYTLSVNRLRGLTYPASKLKLGSLDTRLSGSVSLSEAFEPTYIAAKGFGNLTNLKFDKERIGKASFEVDVAGRPPLLRGDVDLQGEDIEAGGQSLEKVSANASIKQDGDFTLTASATTKAEAPGKDSEGEKRAERLKISATGNLSDSLDEVSNLTADLYNLNEDPDDPVWSIDDATISTKGGQLKVQNLSLVNEDQSIKIDGTYRERGAQDLSVEAKNVKLAQLREELALTDVLPEVKGTVETVDFSLQGTAREPEIEIDIIVKDFYYETFGPFDLVLKGRYKNNKLTLNTLDLDGYGTDLIRGQARVPMSLDLAGNVDFFWKENIIITVFIDPIDLGELSRKFASLEAYQLFGKIEGGGIINGTLRTPKLDFTLNAETIRFKGEVAGQALDLDNMSLTNKFEYEPPEDKQGGFKLGTRLKKGERTLASVDASSPIPIANWLYEILELGNEVDFATEVSAQPFALDARFDKLDLQEVSKMGLTQDLKLQGIFNFEIDGKGTFEEPRVRLTTSLDAFHARGPITDQRIDLRDIDFSSVFTLDGKKGSLDPMTLTANMTWQDHKMLDAMASMEIPLNGWLTRQSRGETIDFAKELQTIPFDLDVTIDKLDLSKVAVAPLLKEPDAAGLISVNLDARGTLRDPSGSVSMNIGEIECKSDPTQKKPCNGLGWDRYRDIVVETSLNLKDRRLTLQNFLVNWDDLDIAQAFGSLPLPLDTLLDGAPLKDIDYDFTLNLKPVPLKKLSAIDYTFASLTGAMKGKMHLTGSLRKPEARGCFALLDARLGKNRSSTGSIGLELDSRKQSVIGAMKFCESDQTDPSRDNNYANICTLDNTQLSTCNKGKTLAYANMAARLNTDVIALSKGADPLIPDAASRVKQGPLTADNDIFVSIHTRDKQPLKLQDVLPMNILRNVARDIQGTLAVDVDIQGTYEAPIPTGRLQLSDGGITLPDLGRRFDEIALAATMDMTTVKLEKLRVAEGNSDIILKGTLDHDKLVPTTVAADLNAKDFNIGDFVDFPFFASGQMDMKGTLDTEPMNLTVDVNKLDVQLTEDIGSNLHPTELDSDILVLGRNEDGSLMIEGDIETADDELSGSGEDLVDTLKLNTRVKMSRQCWVRHPYGEVNVTGDFTAMLDGASLTMSGGIEAPRGQAEFLGKIFRVERAIITFTGADPPDPRLQIEAVYELDQNIVASLGPASDGRPRIMVLISGNSTEPVLKLRSDPPMSETDIIYVLATNRPPGTSGVGQDSSVAAAALSAASGLLVGMLKDELSDNLPLDFFDVLNVDTSNFEVGKYVYNGKIYLSYRYLFGNIDGNSSIYQFDYHFLPRWTLEAQGSSGANGGELNLNVFWDAF